MAEKSGLIVERGTKMYRMVRNRNLKVLGTAIIIFLVGFYLLYTGVLFPRTYQTYSGGTIIYVVDEQSRQHIEGVFIFDIPFMLLGCYGFYLFATRTIDKSRHPDIKRFTKFSDPQGLLDQFESEISGDQVIKFQEGRSTPSFLVHESFYRFRWAKYSEIAWAYEQRTKHSFYFIPIYSTYKIIVHIDKRHMIQMDCKNEKEAKAILKRIRESAPHAVYGYSEDLKKAWNRDNDGVMNAIKARAQQAAENERQYQGQVNALYDALGQNNVTRSLTIIDEMGRIRNRQAIEPLTILLDDPDVSIRLHCVQALGNIGDRSAVGALETMKVPASNSVLYSAKLKAIEQINLKNM